MSPGGGNAPNLKGLLSPENCHTLDPAENDAGKLPSLQNKSPEHTAHHSGKKPFESILEQIQRATNENDRQSK